MANFLDQTGLEHVLLSLQQWATTAPVFQGGGGKALVLADDLPSLEGMAKDQATLYCVGSSLYRWDGMKLIPLGSDGFVDLSGLVELIECLREMIG